jgi:hypothetical protein
MRTLIMNVQFRHRFVLAATVTVFAIGLLSPVGVYAAPEGGNGTSTATLVGAVTCGADEITPAANAIVSVTGLPDATRTDSSGRFTLTNVPAGQRIRIDVTNDPQQSSMASRFNVVTDAGQTLDIGSMDLGICPLPNTPAVTTTDQEIEQRGSPTD